MKHPLPLDADSETGPPAQVPKLTNDEEAPSLIPPLDNTTIKQAVKEYFDFLEWRKPVSTNYGPIEEWDTSHVTSMEKLFYFKNLKNIDLSRWNVSNVTNMINMFHGCSNIGDWISKWDVSNVERMTSMFLSCTDFNQPLNNWNVSKAQRMYGVFYGCKNFNQPLNNWDVSRVVTMESMFHECQSFNQPLNDWNVSNVENMWEMFFHCIVFNQPLNNWDISNCQSLSYMFAKCDAFNQPLDSWNISQKMDIRSMFSDCKSFNQPLDSWDIIRTDDLTHLFSNCTSFNQPLNHLKMSNVRNMYGMLSGCSVFNQPLNDWDVSRVTNMENLFSGCVAFNQPLNDWNVSNVVNMKSMFSNCGFNQDINNWNIQNESKLKMMFENNEHFNKIIGCAELPAGTKSRYYVIEKEMFDGNEYQVMTIPKGMLLCTSYKESNFTEQQKWTHYYGLDKPLENYYDYGNKFKAGTEKTPRIYFFPIPLMTNFVKDYFNAMEVMVTTKDLRLLCLISPAPTARRVRHKGKVHLRNCLDHEYDLCLSNAIYQGLRLHGNIAIAAEDGMKRDRAFNYPEIFNYSDKIAEALCFNGDYTKLQLATRNLLLKQHNSRKETLRQLVSNGTMVCGIPEIVLRPFDFPNFVQGLPITSDELRQRFLADGYRGVEDYVIYKGLFSVSVTPEETEEDEHSLAIKATEIFNDLFTDKKSIQTCRQAPGLFYFVKDLCDYKRSLIDDDQYASNTFEDYDFQKTYAELAKHPETREVSGPTLEMAGFYLKKFDAQSSTRSPTTNGGSAGETSVLGVARSAWPTAAKPITTTTNHNLVVLKKQASAKDAAAVNAAFSYRETKHGLPILIIHANNKVRSGGQMISRRRRRRQRFFRTQRRSSFF